MLILLLSLISGALTVFAPCALPMLPIIVGGSLKESSHPKKRTLIITLSLGLSVFIFSLLIKFSSLLLRVEPSFWAKVSGATILSLGVFNLFPNLWMRLSAKLKLMGRAEQSLSENYKKDSQFEPILTGLALGPVFSSCNPIYLFIISVLLPQNLTTGIINLLAYCLGLSLMMLALSLGSRKLVTKLKWAANPKSWFRRALGITFIIIGIMIFTGTEKKLEAWVLEKNSWFTNYVKFEQNLLPN
jgi:cytochrome c biogenesis protein CcdA